MASYTTNLNLKKPAGSENVAIGDINNNMDTIDQAFGTLNPTAWVQGGTSTWYYRKQLNIVSIKNTDYGSITLPTVWTELFTLPEGFRPSNDLFSNWFGTALNSEMAHLKITTTGQVYIAATGSAPSYGGDVLFMI